MSGPFHFGHFSFDASSGTLLRQGVPVRLQPQPARVLAILLAHAGEAVTREELRQQIWPKGTYVDFERGLNFSIARIRAALNDTAEGSRYIETLPKRGYRFVAPVRMAPDVSSNGHPDPGAAAPPPEKLPPARRWRLAAVAAIVVLAGAGAAIWYRPVPAVPRVAVVSFDNETGQDTYDDVAVSIADQTVARLAAPERLTRLRVIGNAAALRKPRDFRDIQAIGEDVGAQYVVLAQMKLDSRKVRLIAHLIRVNDQTHLWANIFDRDDFTLDAQAEIADLIARAVTSRIATP